MTTEGGPEIPKNEKAQKIHPVRNRPRPRTAPPPAPAATFVAVVKNISRSCSVAAFKMNLHTLLKEMVEEIATHLSYDDLISLAMTHPELFFIMPREEVILGPDLDPITWRFNPETHLDVPILSRGLVEVRLWFQWKNEGYRTARVWLQLIRDTIYLVQLDNHLLRMDNFLSSTHTTMSFVKLWHCQKTTE